MTVQEFTQRLLAHMGVEDATVEVEEGETTLVKIQVAEEESGLLIGYHGECLTALQRVLYMAYSREDQNKKFLVNVNDYKERRTNQLQEMARSAAEKVLENGQPYGFSYLSASERLIVHEFIANTPEFAGLESYSTGDGQRRRLYIRPKEESDQELAA
ncbi:KH domain-containing protein [Patescibacteria group bacterium]|nr:KH domain-containing protein [Patescibacteria group bacterium]